ncbi:hypothetical protein GF367_01615 [Candidatus Woesearchaeota archaeon]|nr:hypothetical protein [Candidatus Woesearchaeota archaeon]
MQDETKHYTRVGYKELLAMLLTAAVIGFVMSFRDWGQDTIDVTQGVTTLIVASVTAFTLILLRTAAQKWIALKMGYLTTYTFHKYALPASFFLAFFLNGLLPYVSPGNLHIQASKRLRLGTFRYGLNYEDLALISLAAPAVCVLLMILVKPIYLATNNILIHEVVQTTAAVAVFGLLPINGQEGFNLIYFRRWLWVITFMFVGVYFLLILATSVFSYVIAVIVAIAAMWVYQAYLNSGD